MVKYNTGWKREESENELQMMAARDFGGDKVHIMAVGSSVTTCGLWRGRSALSEVDQEISCKKCIRSAPLVAKKIHEALINKGVA